jgi:hypothetical protein
MFQNIPEGEWKNLLEYSKKLFSFWGIKKKPSFIRRAVKQ